MNGAAGRAILCHPRHGRRVYGLRIMENMLHGARPEDDRSLAVSAVDASRDPGVGAHRLNTLGADALRIVVEERGR